MIFDPEDKNGAHALTRLASDKIASAHSAAFLEIDRAMKHHFSISGSRLISRG